MSLLARRETHESEGLVGKKEKARAVSEELVLFLPQFLAVSGIASILLSLEFTATKGIGISLSLYSHGSDYVIRGASLNDEPSE
jgi:hypothetical protein